jgi:hypothetical protein
MAGFFVALLRLRTYDRANPAAKIWAAFEEVRANSPYPRLSPFPVHHWGKGHFVPYLSSRVVSCVKSIVAEKESLP